MATFQHDRNKLIYAPETVYRLHATFDLPADICAAHIAATDISRSMRERLEDAAAGLILIGESDPFEEEAKSQMVATLRKSLEALATELSITLYEEMPKTPVAWDEAVRIVTEIFERELGPGWTTPNPVSGFKGDANVVADALLSYDAQGHFSHGVERIIRYLQWMRSGSDPNNGRLDPNGKCKMEDLGHMGRFDGACTFGQVGMQWGLEQAMAKASQRGSYLMAGSNLGHVGRLEYSLRQAVRHGFFALGMLNTNGGRAALDLNGIDALLGTNPFGMGVPDGDDGSVFDMATSEQPEGAINVMMQQGLLVPSGLLRERDGTTTLDPSRLYDKPIAVIAPAGRHKGLGLGIMGDVSTAALTAKGHDGTDSHGIDKRAVNNGWIQLVLIDGTDHHGLIHAYREKLARVNVIGETHRRGVLPGVRGYQAERQARAGSVLIPDKIWEHVLEVHKTGKLPEVKT